MRGFAVLCLLLTAVFARAERVLLVPVDSRPAAGQFAYMIGKMASVDVQLPNYSLLGRFTQPGSPEAILQWLQDQDYRDVSAVVVSTDMIAYGGLIASRVPTVDMKLALSRLQKLAQIRQKAPNTKFYLSSAIMRLAPTATRATAGWRLQLARYAELKNRYERGPDKKILQSINNLLAKIPPVELLKYRNTRARNLEVQRELIKMVARKQFDYLLFGQDDAQAYGPHIPETARLKLLTKNLSVGGSVYFSEGIDQHANILVSRALIKRGDWTPTVRVVYSDEAARKRIAAYESKPIDLSLSDQILASGARPQENGSDPYDYTLYVNVPGRREPSFQAFAQSLTSEIEQGFPVAVADINIGKDGTADQELFDALDKNGRMMKLLSYAGWNTAGNTLGTSIPAANVYLLARRLNTDPLMREVSQREFLLHRFVNDYAYHKFTRKKAYAIIDANPTASREETYGAAFDEVDGFVRQDLTKYLDQYWREDFLDKHFFAGAKEYKLTSLTDTRVFLPWPRAYEVRLEFKMHAEPVQK